MDTLMGDEHHRAGLGMLLGQDLKERTGLKVAVTDPLDHLLVALDHPGMNGSTGFQPEFRLTASCGNDLKNRAFREEISKPVRIPAIIGILHPDTPALRVRSLPGREATPPTLILHFRGLGNNSQPG